MDAGPGWRRAGHRPAPVPALRVLYSDDIVNSTLPGILENASVSLWQFIQSINHVWLDKGRFYPVGLAATYLTWDLAPGLLANRLVQVALIVSNVFAAMWLLRTLGFHGPRRGPSRH